MQELSLPAPPSLKSYPSLSNEGFSLASEQLVARGFDLDTQEGKRAYRFINFAGWTANQFESKTGQQLTPESVALATDVSILMALYDDTNDTGQAPDWGQDYAPAIVGPFPGVLNLPSVASEFGCPEEFSASLRSSASSVPPEKLASVARSWNDLVIGMYDHKVAAVEGRGTNEFILSRAQEAIALSDLFSDIFYEDRVDLYDFLEFKKWFELEMLALNMSNAWFDYIEDKEDGHKPLGKVGWLTLTAATAHMCQELWIDPATSSDDKEFFAYYTNRLVVPKWKRSVKEAAKASAFSQLSCLGRT